MTTSTCSGRISVFASASNDLVGQSSASAGAATTSKGGGRWALSSHAPVEVGAVLAAMATVTAQEDAVLKHEPAILHVRCCDLQWVSPHLVLAAFVDHLPAIKLKVSVCTCILSGNVVAQGGARSGLPRVWGGAGSLQGHGCHPHHRHPARSSPLREW